jgi:hypothetical protein
VTVGNRVDLVNTEKEAAVGLKAIEIELGFKLINEATAHDTSIITGCTGEEEYKEM